ncbi:MAG: hypothetical protein L3K10_00600 [Thermoplasmata archaeon]|nr:hypothetical protein [Thermoplasmata archaeon]
MRTGLVVVGVALAVVGAGLTLSAFFEPGAPSLTQVNPLAAPNLQPGLPRTMVVWLQNTSSGSLELNWVSSSNVNVSFYRATNCGFLGVVKPSDYCPDGPPIVSWASNASGHWNTTGRISFPCLLNLQNPGPKTVNVTAVFDEVWASTGPKVPTWVTLSTIAGGIACISIGGVAIFLGLFLRSGVYARPPREESLDEVRSPRGGGPEKGPSDDSDDDLLEDPPE